MTSAAGLPDDGLSTVTGAVALVEAVRRTTITTYDMVASLAFYRDALGLEIWYDGEVAGEEVCAVYDLPPATVVRVCVLRPPVLAPPLGVPVVVAGMVGLMSFVGLPAPPVPEQSRRPVPGEMVLMFGTTRLLEVERRLRAGGFHVQGPPLRLSVPGRAVVHELLCRDPNGVRVAFAQASELGT
jgi:catechol 2,3-dioxygenase-like lactoylglutathione lyase family enzyme